MRTPTLSLLVALACCGCTPGGIAPPAGATSAQTTIDVDLTLNGPITTPYGMGGGFAPGVVSVAVGTTIRFVNTDGFAHTSSSFAATTFPAASPLGSNALSTFGGTLSGGWSSGSMPAGGSSQSLLADKPGTYLFGCFYHYAAPMRGAIVVH